MLRNVTDVQWQWCVLYAEESCRQHSGTVPLLPLGMRRRRTCMRPPSCTYAATDAATGLIYNAFKDFSRDRKDLEVQNVRKLTACVRKLSNCGMRRATVHLHWLPL
jgi:hypothetical protein